jgi:hypothetical protein
MRLLVLVLALALANPASAETFYRWRDANGVLHMTNSPAGVPRDRPLQTDTVSERWRLDKAIEECVTEVQSGNEYSRFTPMLTTGTSFASPARRLSALISRSACRVRVSAHRERSDRSIVNTKIGGS